MNTSQRGETLGTCRGCPPWRRKRFAVRKGVFVGIDGAVPGLGLRRQQAQLCQPKPPISFLPEKRRQNKQNSIF